MSNCVSLLFYFLFKRAMSAQRGRRCGYFEETNTVNLGDSSPPADLFDVLFLGNFLFLIG